MAEQAPGNYCLDVDAIGAHLVDHGVAVTGPLTARPIAGGRSNLTYLVSSSDTSWVVRRPPRAGLTSSAHDMAREFRVTTALAGTDVPVPTPVVLCEDLAVIGAPFTVVEFVEGSTIRTQDDLAALDDTKLSGCVEALVHSLAALHAVDYEAVGLRGFGRPDAYAARQLRRWSGQSAQMGGEAHQAADSLAQELGRRIPNQARASVVHGDFRIDNTLLALDEASPVKAIVDWELSTIGDPVADVALMCVYRHPALNLILGGPAAWTSQRLPSVDDLAALYETQASVRLENWEFHLALAYFKLAVIAQGIDHRYRAGATTGDGFDQAGEAVPELLAQGQRLVRGH